MMAVMRGGVWEELGRSDCTGLDVLLGDPLLVGCCMLSLLLLLLLALQLLVEDAMLLQVVLLHLLLLELLSLLLLLLLLRCDSNLVLPLIEVLLGQVSLLLHLLLMQSGQLLLELQELGELGVWVGTGLLLWERGGWAGLLLQRLGRLLLVLRLLV